MSDFTPERLNELSRLVLSWTGPTTGEISAALRAFAELLEKNPYNLIAALQSDAAITRLHLERALKSVQNS